MLRKKLATIWKEKGFKDGDTVMIHSQIRRIFKQYRHELAGEDFTEVLLASFLDAVGDSGTLLFPLFNFDFCKGMPFDIRTTPSKMGALTEAARLHPETIRTKHPAYSFAVLGKNKEAYAALENINAYGVGTPFELLKNSGGKIAVLNLPDQKSMTFYHHVEEILQVPYRYYKDFSGDYTDSDGITTRKTFNLYVRDIENKVLTHVNPMGEILWQEGIYSGDKFDEGAGLRIAKAEDIYRLTENIIQSGKAEGLLFKYGE